MAKTAEDIIQGIDFSQLKAQKLTLLGTIDELEREGKLQASEDLTGILNMIDSIQDHAVDVLGFKEEDVFNKDPEDVLDPFRETISKWLQNDGYTEESANKQAQEAEISIKDGVTEIKYSTTSSDFVIVEDGEIITHLNSL